MNAYPMLNTAVLPALFLVSAIIGGRCGKRGTGTLAV